jgi:hypothetical protein
MSGPRMRAGGGPLPSLSQQAAPVRLLGGVGHGARIALLRFPPPLTKRTDCDQFQRRDEADFLRDSSLIYLAPNEP